MFVKEITNEVLEKVLQDLYVKGTVWDKSKTDHYMIKRTSLKPECRIWVSFLKLTLMPTVHTTTVRKERLLLLHSIMKGRKINVGQVIQDEVHNCAQKNSSSLIFPNLITALCL